MLRRPDSLSMNLCDNSEDYSREQVTNRRWFTKLELVLVFNNLEISLVIETLEEHLCVQYFYLVRFLKW